MKDVRSEKAADRSLERADQGRDQSRPTVSLRPSDAAKSTPILRPSAARITPAAPSLRRGAEACAFFASRAFPRGCDAADRRHPLADTRLGSRQGTASAVPNAAQPSGVSTPEARCHAQTSLAKTLSNREHRLLELTLTHRKQTIAPRPNRELSTNRCRDNSHAVIPTLTFLTGLPRAFFAKGSVCTSKFLTGSASQTEFAVTNSKQTTGAFLTGSRFAQHGAGIDTLSRLAQHGARAK
jgi:hypothetical protein